MEAGEARSSGCYLGFAGPDQGGFYRQSPRREVYAREELQVTLRHGQYDAELQGIAP
jgi:hypothetical protein